MLRVLTILGCPVALLVFAPTPLLVGLQMDGYFGLFPNRLLPVLPFLVATVLFLLALSCVLIAYHHHNASADEERGGRSWQSRSVLTMQYEALGDGFLKGCVEFMTTRRRRWVAVVIVALFVHWLIRNQDGSGFQETVDRLGNTWALVVVIPEIIVAGLLFMMCMQFAARWAMDKTSMSWLFLGDTTLIIFLLTMPCAFGMRYPVSMFGARSGSPTIDSPWIAPLIATMNYAMVAAMNSMHVHSNLVNLRSCWKTVLVRVLISVAPYVFVIAYTTVLGQSFDTSVLNCAFAGVRPVPNSATLLLLPVSATTTATALWVQQVSPPASVQLPFMSLDGALHGQLHAVTDTSLLAGAGEFALLNTTELGGGQVCEAAFIASQHGFAALVFAADWTTFSNFTALPVLHYNVSANRSFVFGWDASLSCRACSSPHRMNTTEQMRECLSSNTAQPPPIPMFRAATADLSVLPGGEAESVGENAPPALTRFNLGCFRK